MIGPGRSSEVGASEYSLIQLTRDAVELLRTSNHFEDATKQIIPRLGQVLRAARCALVELHMSPGEPPLVRWRIEWPALDGEALSLSVPGADLDNLAWLHEMERGVRLDGLLDCPPELLAVLFTRGTRSLAVAPVHIGGAVSGWLVVEDSDEQRSWGQYEVDGLHLIADLLGSFREQQTSHPAPAALEADEKRLRLALEAGSIGAWDWDILTDEVTWSSNMERLHGLEPGSFDGTFGGYKEGIHPDDYDFVVESLQRALAGDTGYHLEYRSRRSDGSYQWIATHGSVIWDDASRPVRMTGVCYDISPRKQAEAAQQELLTKLQRAQAEADAEVKRLKDLFQYAPAMMALLEGPEHAFVLVNDHYAVAVGHRDVLGKTIVEALPEIENQGLIELLDAVYQTGETITRSELPVMVDIAGDGNLEERYFSFAYQPFRDAEGVTTGVLVHAVDLTDHVRSRQRVEYLAREVANERDRLQQVIDVLPEGVALCDSDGKITLSNKAAWAIWGQLPPAGGFDDYVLLNPLTRDLDPYPIEELPLTRSVRYGETVLGEQMVVRNVSTGENIDVLVNSVPLKYDSGEIAGGVAVFQDIRPLKEFEQQKDEFLQTITHDLKNPLTTILGGLQLFQRSESIAPERMESANATMEMAARRAIALVDEILDLTRLQMGRPLEMSVSPVDLVGLVRQIADQHQSATSIHQLEVESESSELIGEWDRVRLERVLANLVSNAINYSPNGGRIAIRVRANEQDCAILEIEDQGMGIPSHEMPRLFERFWRGSNVRQQVPGTGLGLAGARAIIEAHGGEISVTSEEGQGTTFIVRLPCDESSAS